MDVEGEQKYIAIQLFSGILIEAGMDLLSTWFKVRKFIFLSRPTFCKESRVQILALYYVFQYCTYTDIHV